MTVSTFAQGHIAHAPMHRCGTVELRADPFDAGPYNRFQAFIGLMRSDALHIRRRAALYTFVAWLPLVLLSAAQGLAIGATPEESMLLDVAAHARYLIALPLLVLVESWTLPGLAIIARHFDDAGLIADASRPQYRELLESTRRMLASPRTDFAILVLAYAITVSVPSALYPMNESTWVRPASESIHQLTLAGWWRTFVSQPLYLLLVIGWFWRIVLWGRFLAGISRLQLNLIPSHPDHAGGLGFSGASLRAFLPLVFALPIPIAGTIAVEILQRGRHISEFNYVIAAVIIGELLLFTLPLMLLAPRLLRERSRGLLEYSALAGTMGKHFEQRWLHSPMPAKAGELSMPDFSATTDLYAIASNVSAMKLVPVNKFQLTFLVFAAGLPFVPVLLIALPFKDIAQFVANFLL